MSEIAIPDAIQRFYESINTGDMSQIDSVLAADLIDHEDMPGITSTGGQRFKDFVTMVRGAFPDLKVSREDTIVSGDRASVRFAMSGTMNGSFMGMPATGKSFRIEGVDILRFENGKCVEHWGFADMIGLMAQLGLMPGHSS